MIHHIVLWTLHEPADAPRFKTLLDGCAAIVPGIERFEVGIRSEGLEASADVVLVSAFRDAEALAAYQAHPAHQAVLGPLGAMRKERRVLDFDAA